jgi:hypothetical protein
VLNDWIALAAVAGSTSVGLAGILATIYGSKRQADAVLAQIAGEAERQAAQHDEDHRRNRQATYHLFLTATAQLRALPPLRSETEDDRRAAGERRWEFLHLLNGVELFGTEAVRGAALSVRAAIERKSRAGKVEVFESPPGYVGEEGRESIQAIFDLLRDAEVRELMDELIAAMRVDVAPGPSTGAMATRPGPTDRRR